MFYVYSPWFFLFLTHLFSFLFLPNVTSSVHILYLIKLSTAAATCKIQTATRLQQVTAFCWGLYHHRGNKFSMSNSSHSGRPNDRAFGLPSQWPSLTWLRAFPTWSFTLSFPLLTPELIEHLCPRVGNTSAASRDGCKAANKREGLSLPAPQVVTCSPLNKKVLQFSSRGLSIFTEKLAPSFPTLHFPLPLSTPTLYFPSHQGS